MISVAVQLGVKAEMVKDRLPAGVCIWEVPEPLMSAHSTVMTHYDKETGSPLWDQYNLFLYRQFDKKMACVCLELSSKDLDGDVLEARLVRAGELLAGLNTAEEATAITEIP